MALSTAENMNSKERFSTRVDAYREFRPRYPVDVITLLRQQCGLTPASVIADVGAGTGMLSELFLQHGNSVFGVEPNRAMRSACEELRSEYPKLTCIDGSAEATTLPDHCADFVTVGQALHWFHLERARAEFVRILQPGGWCAVIYNERRVDGDAFHDGYERILREFGTDYESVRSKYPHQEKLADFFRYSHATPPAVQQASFPNSQKFNLVGLMGRILSSSYMPQPEHPRYAGMQRGIEELFSQCQQSGRVRLEYDCVVTYGHLE
ncbi:MAG TPA: class I SAM-dependent methyltransferase [Acidobacteriaceae bacterium]|nr:class I SAM-dependent methyltransferase [Acidobacteriaceae bacterium]